MKPQLTKKAFVTICGLGKIQVGGKPPICHSCGFEIQEGEKKTINHPAGGTKTFWKHYECKW